jgi:acyl-CoA reductase-like NAD-dependent aldehyde dehydrogenase
MSIIKDETFGPVVEIMSVDDDEQALMLMNDSVYGLVSNHCV